VKGVTAMARQYRAGAGTRAINWLFRQLTRLGLGASYRQVLTVRGRKTGREHSTPVDVMDYDGSLWLVAPYGVTNWVKNARAAGTVKLSRGHRSQRFRASEVQSAEAIPVLRMYIKEVPVTRPYFDSGPNAADDAIAGELARHPVFRLIKAA
jgi:deazaflavin-dependent oxidoreductase (nitroreductase family)